MPRLAPTFPYLSLTLFPQLLLQSQYFSLLSSLGPFLLQSTSFVLSWLLPRSVSLPPAIPIPGFIFLVCTFTGPLSLNLPFGPDPFLTTFLFDLSELLAQPSLRPPSLNCLSRATSGLLLPSRSGSHCLHLHTRWPLRGPPSEDREDRYPAPSPGAQLASAQRKQDQALKGKIITPPAARGWNKFSYSLKAAYEQSGHVQQLQ